MANLLKSLTIVPVEIGLPRDRSPSNRISSIVIVICTAWSEPFDSGTGFGAAVFPSAGEASLVNEYWKWLA